MKKTTHNQYRNRIDSLINKIKVLSSLRKIVALPPELDISERQWSVLESNLFATQARLLQQLMTKSQEYLKTISEPESEIAFNSLLGKIEIDLSRALTFFDTFMDILTQRNTAELGAFLAGCDVLAWDALKKDHPALDIVDPPLVFCDRGFGASILREGVPLPNGGRNPMPTIQIPYSKLREKYNLTSIIHETGHEAMVRLGLVTSIPKELKSALLNAGAPKTIQDLFAIWSSEIGPDFWTFCNCGIAQASSIKEILSLPPNQVLRVSFTDPHPPPYLRILLSFEWCRQMWGAGQCDEWEKEWLFLYPLDNVESNTRKILELGKKYLYVVAKTLINARFRTLYEKNIPSLFSVDSVAPWKIDSLIRKSESGILDLTGLSPCIQLCLFRTLRDTSRLSESVIDKMMSIWLIQLGKRKMFI